MIKVIKPIQVIPKKIKLKKNCACFINKFERFSNNSVLNNKIKLILEFMSKKKFLKQYNLYKPFYEKARLSETLQSYLQTKKYKLIAIYEKYNETNNISYITDCFVPNLLLFYEYNKDTILQNKLKNTLLQLL